MTVLKFVLCAQLMFFFAAGMLIDIRNAQLAQSNAEATIMIDLPISALAEFPIASTK